MTQQEMENRIQYLEELTEHQSKVIHVLSELSMSISRQQNRHGDLLNGIMEIVTGVTKTITELMKKVP